MLPKNRDPRRVRILGVAVDLTSSKELLARLGALEPAEARHLVYVNAHSLNLTVADRDFRDAVDRADFVLNDGIGVTLAGRMRDVRFSENLNGSDLTPAILATAAVRGLKVFFYGGRPGVAQTAAQKLAATIPGLDIVGTLDGYGGHSGSDVAATVRAAGSDILVVALGQPEQELWLDRHLAGTGCRLGLGVGAFLDFSSGRVTRAPGWANRAGLEWLHRLAIEPKRLSRRYLIGAPMFLWRAWRSRRADVATD